MFDRVDARTKRDSPCAVVHNIDVDVVPRRFKSNDDTDSFEAKSLI